MAAAEQRETKTNQSAPLIFFTWNGGIEGSTKALARLVGSSEAIQSNSTMAFMERQINCDTCARRTGVEIGEEGGKREGGRRRGAQVGF